MKPILTLLAIVVTATSLSSQADQLPTVDTLENVVVLEPGIGINSSFELDHKRDNGDIQLLRNLQGRIAGLEIMSAAGSPGASISTLLRGHNSVLNSNGPLIVLDGMIIDNSEWGNELGGTDQSNRLIDINPNDIQSVKVLKGSVASASYGIRGSNGVIELTSKSVGDQLNIQISSAITFTSPGKLIELQSQYAQGVPNQYLGPETISGTSWGPAISDLEFDGDSSYEFDKKGRLVPRGFGNGIAATAYDPYDFYRQGTSRNLNVFLSNGTDKLKYRISANNSNIGGIIPTAAYKRSSISGHLQYLPTERLTVSTDARYILSNATRTNTGSNLSGITLSLTRTTPTFDNANGLSPKDALADPSAYELADGSQRSYRQGIYANPYWLVNKDRNDQNVGRIIANAKAEYKITDRISANMLTGIDQYTDKRNGGIDINPNRSQGSAYENELTFSTLYTQFNVKGLYQINSAWKVTSTIGADFYRNKQIFNNSFASGLNSSGLVTIANSRNVTSTSNSSSRATAGLFATANFNYNDYLDIGINARNDRSSALGTEANSLWSYSINGALDILQIGAQSTSDTNEQLKISFGIGRTGNDIMGSLNRSTSMPTQIGGDGFLTSTTLPNAFTLSGLAQNTALAPEVTNAREIGLHVTQLENRLKLGVNLYSERTNNVILLSPVNSATGFSNQLQNKASISNKGIEVEMMLNILSSNKLSWTIGATAQKNISNVNLTDFDPDGVFLSGFNSVSSEIRDGHPYGVLVGTSFQRDERDRIIVNDDGFPLVDTRRTVQGDPNPDLLLSIANEISLSQKLSISALLEIKRGGDLWCGTCSTLNYLGKTQLSADERGQSIIIDGVTTNGEINQKEIQYADPDGSLSSYYRRVYGFSGVTEENIHDASWIRLRQVSVQYDLADLLKRSIGISGLQVSIYGDNLFLSTKYPGFDPETNLTGTSNGRGIDYYNNPATKSFGFRIHISI